MEDGYLPDYVHVARRAGLSADALQQETVTIPTSLFKFLLSAQARHVPFDGRAYAATNPDVAAAHERGQVTSLQEHYVGTGWFEGRSPGWYFVDDEWYRSYYVDLAIAHRIGKLEDLAAHFYNSGRSEGRVGSAKQLQDKAAWDEAFGAFGASEAKVTALHAYRERMTGRPDMASSG